MRTATKPWPHTTYINYFCKVGLWSLDTWSWQTDIQTCWLQYFAPLLDEIIIWRKLRRQLAESCSLIKWQIHWCYHNYRRYRSADGTRSDSKQSITVLCFKQAQNAECKICDRKSSVSSLVRLITNTTSHAPCRPSFGEFSCTLQKFLNQSVRALRSYLLTKACQILAFNCR